MALVELDHRRACSAAEVDVNRRWLGIVMSINVLGGCGAAVSPPPSTPSGAASPGPTGSAGQGASRIPTPVGPPAIVWTAEAGDGMAILASWGGGLPPVTWVQVTGHFDDPAAAGCGEAFSVGMGKGIDTPARMVTWCRSQFVATRLAVAP